MNVNSEIEQWGNKPEGVIVPLSSNDRDKYNTVIYKHESTIPSDKLLVVATTSAMQEAGFEIVADVDVDRPELDRVVVIRSASENRKAQSVEKALFFGVMEATRRRLEELKTTGGDYQQATHEIAREMVQTVVGKPRLLEAFYNFYGSWRDGVDQKKFVRALFIHGADFDPKFIDKNLRGGDLNTLVNYLGIDIPYDRRESWYEIPAKLILIKHRELDYRRLIDDRFRKSDKGQKLMQAYEYVQGDILARKYESYEPVITDTGEESEPVIPLSKHPVIEALIINEVLLDRPDRNGPRMAVSIALDSDSKPAHQALVKNLTTRVPKGQIRVFEDPREFEYKRDRVSDILRKYQKAKNPKRRELLRDDILELMNAYTGDGVIAKSVREDYRSQVANRTEESWARSDSDIVKEIVVDMLSVAIASPDAELNKRAEDIIKKYLPEQKGAVVRDEDLLVLSREHLMLALIDAVDLVGKDSNLQLIESLGTLIFEDETVGAQLRNFAQMRMRIITERSKPNVLKIFDRFRHSSRGHLTDVDLLKAMKRDFLLTQVEKIANIQKQRKLTDGEAWMFECLIKRIKLGEYHMRNLPPEYYRMMALAKSGDLTERQISTIVWQIYESFKYLGEEAVPLMIKVVQDICESAFGPIDAVRFPTTETSHILGAAYFLVSEYGLKMFQSARQEDLQTLENYINRIREYIREYNKRIAENQPLPKGVLTPEQKMDASKQNWREDAMLNLLYVAQELEFIEQFLNALK